MSAPAISVLIDTYNYGRYVEQAIESVLQQDFPTAEREILVIDDGSTDDTPERVEKYGLAITYLRKPNGGQASAFNCGLERARGKIVAFLDADDYWLPGKLQRLADEFERHPEAGMVYHQLRYRYESADRLEDGNGPLISGFLPANSSDLLAYECFPTSFLAFRRSVLRVLLPIPNELTIMADAYVSRLVLFLAPVVALPEILAVYRLHGSNLFWSAGQMEKGRQLVRSQVTIALARSWRRWLRERGYDLERPDLQTLFLHWQLEVEKARFALRHPSNLRFCRHLLRSTKTFGARKNWKHRAVTYLNAAGSLFVGYQNAGRLDEWRMGVKRALFG
jgi:glycosyltransferase involved in cell wall biosynthesis